MVRKTLITIALLLVIGFSGFFVWVKVQSGGNESSYFVQHLRPWLTRSVTGRFLFDLHGAGDARREFLHAGNQIELVIASMTGLAPSAPVGEQLANRMAQATGNSVTATFSDQAIPYTDKVAEDRLAVLLDDLSPRSWRPAKFYVFFLSRATERQTLLGLTYRENAAVVFTDTIKSDFKNKAPLQSSFMISTALHEFGHQLGLDHNNQPGCLMNESADVSTWYGFDPRVVTNFCNFEKQELAQIKVRP